MANKNKPMNIFVGIPKGITKKEKEAKLQEILSRKGEDFGTYIFPVRNGKIITLLRTLAKCDAAMFAIKYEGDEDLCLIHDICEAFEIPIYK